MNKRTLPARPEAFELDVERTALVVVDMQNAYCSPGGYFDLAGFDLSGVPRVVDAVRSILASARQAGMPIIWLQNGWDKALTEAGALGSVNQLKGNSLKLMRERPELAGTLLTKGSWDYAFVEGFDPRPNEYVIQKSRYSGFAYTSLDQFLRSRGLTTLLVVGVATNVCVESTIRDAFFKEYFPLLVEDACWQAGPDTLQQATVYNVERFFGWVTKTQAVVETLKDST